MPDQPSSAVSRKSGGGSPVRRGSFLTSSRERMLKGNRNAMRVAITVAATTAA
jgi:hypothetical protein